MKLVLATLLISASVVAQSGIEYVEVVHYDHGHKFIRRVKVDRSVSQYGQLPLAVFSGSQNAEKTELTPEEKYGRYLEGLRYAAANGHKPSRDLLLKIEASRAASVQTTTHDAWVRERSKAEAARIETESKKTNATTRVQKP